MSASYQCVALTICRQPLDISHTAHLVRIELLELPSPLVDIIKIPARLTFERVHKAIIHYVPHLHVSRSWRDNEVLLRGRHIDEPDGPRPSNGHGANLRRKWHRQPASERHQQRNCVPIAPGRSRANGDAEKGVVVLVVLHQGTQPSNQLGAQLHGVPGENVARLANRVINQLNVPVQDVAPHVLQEAPQVADGDRLNLWASTAAA